MVKQLVEERITKIDPKKEIYDSNKVQGLGVSSLVYPLSLSTFWCMGIYNIFRLTQEDAYISSIIGAVLGFIPLLFIMYIMKNSKGLDLIDLNNYLFGKLIGTCINVVTNIIFILYGSLILYNVTQFLNIEYLYDTNSLYIEVLIMLPVIYTASKNIAAISRASQIILIINFSLFFVSVLGVMLGFNVDNLLPVMSHGIKPVALGSLQYMILTSLPLIMLTFIPLKLVTNKKNIFKNITWIYILANLTIIATFVFSLGILGIEVVSVYKYPHYMALKTFSLFNIIERVENTLDIQLIFSMCITIVMCIYLSVQSIMRILDRLNISKLKNLDNTKVLNLPTIISTIVAVIIIILSKVLFKNTIYVTEFLYSKLPYIFAITFGSIILLLVITIFIRNMVEKKTKTKVIVTTVKEK